MASRGDDGASRLAADRARRVAAEATEIRALLGSGDPTAARDGMGRLADLVSHRYAEGPSGNE